MADGVVERRDVWVLSDEAVWHPTIEWYARAVAEMKGRDTADLADPRSFAHLAAIHGTTVAPNRWPRGARLHECQHSSWYFLPWHRIYLHHFEKIVRATVAELGGPRDWALPYWNYSDRPTARRLPPAFRRRTWPGSGRNPLFVEERAPTINGRGAVAGADADVGDALADLVFTEPDETPGFGGPVTGWWHGGGPVGSLESVPHGSVHMAVGGVNPPGLMSGFNTAALDPIFWLHHANVDRLWEVWLGRGQGRANPTVARWLNRRFSMGTGAVRTELTVRDVVDTTRAPLRYRYGDMARPATPRRRGPALVGAATTPPKRRRPARLAGATERGVALGATPTSAEFDVAPPPPRRRGVAAAAPQRVYLKLENVKGSSLAAGSYNVYVNLPAGADPVAHDDRRAGHISMFGVMEASGPDPAHSGSGLTFSFEITDLVRRLETAGDWDPAHLRVVFVPLPDAAGRLYEGDVEVGRVSVFYG